MFSDIFSDLNFPEAAVCNDGTSLPDQCLVINNCSDVPLFIEKLHISVPKRFDLQS